MAPELDVDDKLFWEDDQTWSFPVFDNTDKNLDISINLENTKVEQVEKPPSPLAKGKKRSVAARKGEKGGSQAKGNAESDHEVHIWTERERRKKMRNMFVNLHSLLPNLPPKADKSSIVDEAIHYIKKLQQNLDSLEKQKHERIHGISSHALINFPLSTHEMPSREAFLADIGSTSGSSTPMTLASPNVLLPGNEIITNFNTWSSPNVVVNISGTDAHISICGPKKALLLTAICSVMQKYQLEVVSAQVSGDRNRCMFMIHTTHANGASSVFPFPMEEIYKQVATEITWWINS